MIVGKTILAGQKVIVKHDAATSLVNKNLNTQQYRAIRTFLRENSIDGHKHKNPLSKLVNKLFNKKAKVKTEIEIKENLDAPNIHNPNTRKDFKLVYTKFIGDNYFTSEKPFKLNVDNSGIEPKELFDKTSNMLKKLLAETKDNVLKELNEHNSDKKKERLIASLTKK